MEAIRYYYYFINIYLFWQQKRKTVKLWPFPFGRVHIFGDGNKNVKNTLKSTILILTLFPKKEINKNAKTTKNCGSWFLYFFLIPNIICLVKIKKIN